MQHTRGYFIKTIFFSVLLFVESLILVNMLSNYAGAKDYFTVDWQFIGIVAGILLSIAYTYALSIGSWDTWLQFVVVPLPISLANALIVARINYLYGLMAFFVSYLFISYDVFFATQLKEQLIKFNPKIILRFSTKGLLFTFALMAGLFVFLTPTSLEELNIINTAAKITETQLKTLIDNSFSGSMELTLLKNFGLLDYNYTELLAEQIRTFVEPYRDYVVPILSVLVITSVQFINAIVYIIFALTIDLIYFIAKKLNIIKVEYREVMQEILTF